MSSRQKITGYLSLQVTYSKGRLFFSYVIGSNATTDNIDSYQVGRNSAVQWAIINVANAIITDPFLPGARRGITGLIVEKLETLSAPLAPDSDAYFPAMTVDSNGHAGKAISLA